MPGIQPHPTQRKGGDRCRNLHRHPDKLHRLWPSSPINLTRKNRSTSHWNASQAIQLYPTQGKGGGLLRESISTPGLNPSAVTPSSPSTSRNNNTTATFTTVVCRQMCHVLPSGKSVQAGATYSDTIPNAAGCDSLISININALQAVSKPNGKYSFRENLQTADGSFTGIEGFYRDTLQTIGGCRFLDKHQPVWNTGLRHQNRTPYIAETCTHQAERVDNRHRRKLTSIPLQNRQWLWLCDHHCAEGYWHYNL